MAANAILPPLLLDHPLDNPEHYEFIRGQWLKKTSVGRDDHSELELTLSLLLRPIAKRIGSRVLHEWTIVHGTEKLIPDVTLSFPDPAIRDGYLVAPAFLVVESRSKGQRLSSLFDKCRQDYHRIETPYCWVIDAEEQVAYECHREYEGASRLVRVLTAGPDVSVALTELGWS